VPSPAPLDAGTPSCINRGASRFALCAPHPIVPVPVDSGNSSPWLRTYPVSPHTQVIRRLLVANRGEIATRIFRSTHELGIRTIALYSHEDRFALHRFKADEAYRVGRPGEPLRSYLDIESIVATAARVGADAIHPGYGFLSESPEFARAIREAGMVFVGPRTETLEQLGDKTAARAIAKAAGVPVLEGSPALDSVEEARQAAAEMGYPVLLKASKGGGGRGMRIVREAGALAEAFDQARREALQAFGSPEVFLERYIPRAKHIEVQLLGDAHGNLVHLYERDCSVQRRHQKVVEIAPAPFLDPKLRSALCDAALAVGRQVRYENAGTVEFLVDADSGDFFFIEVNPRIQVEHTVTEEVTLVDLVKSQILVASGIPLHDPEIGLPDQASVRVSGFALQCRITTEDPATGFLPDSGRITTYRSAAGMGIRLDAGSAFAGAVVQPYYDSLLVKLTARGRRFETTAHRTERALQEFRIRGVRTNIPFLIRLVLHPEFLSGRVTTRFIDETPELFELPERRDRATRLVAFLGEVIVNGNPTVPAGAKAQRRDPAPVPPVDARTPPTPGTRDRLRTVGPEAFIRWASDQKGLLLTDTSMRDAHQSLLATRMRTRDLLAVADAYARLAPQLFSLEMWGGATFDTSLRFLKEDPWERLALLRERIPNILFQMLLRGSNAVGYTSYPDNVVRAFVEEAAAAGIDLFRIFDALNGVENMTVAMEAALKAGALCEAAICYTGDLLDPSREKYTLDYYVRLARELESRGAHLLAIKDMAGVCTPYAAERLTRALRDEVGIPVHFHTHDTAGTQVAAILKAAEAGLHVADAAMAPLSGGTSQPNLNTLVQALRHTPRDTGLDPAALDRIALYWRAVREFYAPFDEGVVPAASDLYRHGMPGGQYTNLFQQARALGMEDRWEEVGEIYAQVNELFGDIVKVTPTSKAVGDMALYLVANGMPASAILDEGRDLSFPASVVDLMAGRMGLPPEPFPEAVQRRILRGEEPLSDRPGAILPPANLEAAGDEVRRLLGEEPSRRDVLSFLMYPKVYRDYAAHRRLYGDTWMIPTPAFLHGLEPAEELAMDIEPGKTLIIRFLTVGEAGTDGMRTVFFELNGQPREVRVPDRSVASPAGGRERANPDDPTHVAAEMPGLVAGLGVKPGDRVTAGAPLVTLEAMKMETTLRAERDATVGRVAVAKGETVVAGDLLLTLV